MIMDFNGMREKGIYDYVARNYYNLTKEYNDVISKMPDFDPNK